MMPRGGYLVYGLVKWAKGEVNWSRSLMCGCDCDPIYKEI